MSFDCPLCLTCGLPFCESPESLGAKARRWTRRKGSKGGRVRKGADGGRKEDDFEGLQEPSVRPYINKETQRVQDLYWGALLDQKNNLQSWGQWVRQVDVVDLMRYVENERKEEQSKDKVLSTIYENYVSVLRKTNVGGEFSRDLLGKIQFCRHFCFADDIEYKQGEGKFEIFVDCANVGSVLMKQDRTVDGICVYDKGLPYGFRAFHEGPLVSGVRLIEIKGSVESKGNSHVFNWKFRKQNRFRYVTMFIGVFRKNAGDWEKDSPKTDQERNVRFLSFIPVFILERILELWCDTSSDGPVSFNITPFYSMKPKDMSHLSHILSRACLWEPYTPSTKKQYIRDKIFDYYLSDASIADFQVKTVQARVQLFSQNHGRGDPDNNRDLVEKKLKFYKNFEKMSAFGEKHLPKVKNAVAEAVKDLTKLLKK